MMGEQGKAHRSASFRSALLLGALMGAFVQAVSVYATIALLLTLTFCAGLSRDRAVRREDVA